VLERLAAAPISDQTLQWARYDKASSVALTQMTNGTVASFIHQRKRLGLSPELADVRQDIASVTDKDIQSDFQYCLDTRPTLSIVGEEPVVKTAVTAGWR